MNQELHKVEKGNIGTYDEKRASGARQERD